MKDAWSGKPVVGQFGHPIPREAVLLAAPPERSTPEVDHVMPERRERPTICGYRIVRKMACNDLLQPVTLIRDSLVHSPPQLRLDFLELRLHAVAPGLPLKLEESAARFTADEGEAQKREGVRSGDTAFLAIDRRVAAELNHAGLDWVERQRECREPLAHRIEEATCVVRMLEAGHQIIGVTHDDHVAAGFLPSPAFGPQIENVMQVAMAESDFSESCIGGYGSSPSHRRPSAQYSLRPIRRPPGSRTRSVRACQVLRPRRVDQVLALAPLDILPSTTQTVSAPGISFLYRGSDPDCSAPPAQIRACPIKALGSYLECVTLNRWSGHGCCRRTGGTNRSMSRLMRSQGNRCRWLRRRRLRNHLSPKWARKADSMRVLVGTAK